VFDEFFDAPHTTLDEPTGPDDVLTR